MDAPSDMGLRSAALVARVKQGETDAFRELFALVEGPAYALALAHLGNPEDARDVVQDAALESYRRLDCLKDPTRFPGWVCGMVRFLSYRRLRRPRSASLDAMPLEPAAREPEAPAEALPDVKQALFSMPSHYREVLVLRHMEDRTYEDIATLLGLTPAGVDSRLSRARSLLRRKLAALERQGRES